MAVSKKDIKKMFPHLYDELQNGETKVSIDGIRKDPLEAESEATGENFDECECDECHEPKQEVTESTNPDKLRHFNPQAIDFLRRCDTEAQAEEIITYLEKKGEITKEYATELRCKMKKEGVRCFGPKKDEYHYFKEAGLF
jgi:hypothetical protein